MSEELEGFGLYLHIVLPRYDGGEVFLVNRDPGDDVSPATVVSVSGAEAAAFSRRRSQLEFLSNYPFSSSDWRSLTYLVTLLDVPERYSPEVLLNLACLTSVETRHLATWIQELWSRVCDHVCFTSCPNWIYQFRRWRANLLASDVWLPLPVAAVFSRK